MIWDFKTGDQVPPSYTVKLKHSIHVGEEVTFPSQKHTTGADGRWTARNLPPELPNRISITGSHSNFIDVRVSLDDKPEIESELRAGTYQANRGLEVRGRVNEEQQPKSPARNPMRRTFGRSRSPEAKSPSPFRRAQIPPRRFRSGKFCLRLQISNPSARNSHSCLSHASGASFFRGLASAGWNS